MRKLSILLAFGLTTTLFYPVKAEEEYLEKGEKKEMHKWCEQNWEKCKELKLERLKIREKYLSKEKECVEKANSFQDMRQCLKDTRYEMHKEMKELHKNFKKQKS